VSHSFTNPKIDEIHKDNEIPIVVGGTSYWIQNLVFSDRLVGSPQVISTATKSSHKTLEELHHFTSKITDPDLLHIFATLPESPPSASSDGDAAYQLHALLNMIDPAMASRWHWRDTRRVLRSLEIIKETGHKASDIVTEQTLRTAAAKPRFVLPLDVRYQCFILCYRFRTLFLWLYAEHSILKQRLYDRVDRMIEA